MDITTDLRSATGWRVYICEKAADEIDSLRAEIASLRDTLRQWKYAEDNDDRDELANARTNRDAALAQVAEVGNG